MEAEIGLDGTLLAGSLPRRALQLVEDWRTRYPDELAANWEHASRKEPINPYRAFGVITVLHITELRVVPSNDNQRLLELRFNRKLPPS